MKKVIFYLSLFLPHLSLAGSIANNPSDLSLQECTLPKVISTLDLQYSDRQADIATNILTTSAAIEKIMSEVKAPKNNLPIAKQLSPENLNKFSIDSQKLETMEITNLVESRQQRDLAVIKKLTETADNLYRWNKKPDQKDPDYIYYLFLSIFKLKLPSVDTISSAYEKCSLDYALFNFEKEPALKLSAMSRDLNSALSNIDKIYAKYNMNRDNFNYDKLNDNDKIEITSIGNKFIIPAQNEKDYITNLENIRYYAKIYSLIYTSSLKDVLDSGGDPTKVGDTIESEKQSGKLNKTDALMIAIWGLIENKIPPEWLKERERLDKHLNQSVTINVEVST